LFLLLCWFAVLPCLTHSVVVVTTLLAAGGGQCLATGLAQRSLPQQRSSPDSSAGATAM
jgi:hypothetical protein